MQRGFASPRDSGRSAASREVRSGPSAMEAQRSLFASPRRYSSEEKPAASRHDLSPGTHPSIPERGLDRSGTDARFHLCYVFLDRRLKKMLSDSEISRTAVASCFSDSGEQVAVRQIEQEQGRSAFTTESPQLDRSRHCSKQSCL